MVAAGQGELARARAQLAAGDPVAALDALLAAWTRCKAAEIAVLIDALGAHVARALPPIATAKREIDAAFRDVADQLRPADVPRLVTALPYGTATQVGAWLEILDRFPVDPRLCPPAIEHTVRFVATSAGKTRTRAVRLAEKIGDGRCLPQLAEVLERTSDGWNWKELLDRVRKLAATFAPPPPLPEDDRATVEALVAAIGELARGPAPSAAALFPVRAPTIDDDARLLAEVLAHPDDTAARLVYADHLQQRGDPRGELIALQLQPSLRPAQQQRVRELVGDTASVTRWLGPLAAVVVEPVFAGGFLARCRVKYTTDKQREELLEHPLWATVRALECREPAAIASPAMRSLREVTGLDLGGVATLAAQPRPLGITAIRGVPFQSFRHHPYGSAPQDDIPAWAPVLAVGALANLRALGLVIDWQTEREHGASWPAYFAWLTDSALGRQLTELQFDLYAGVMRAQEWVGLFERPQLERLVVRRGFRKAIAVPDIAVTATRDGDRLAFALDLARPFHHSAEALVRHVFEELTAPRAATLAVTVTSKHTRAQLALLRDHIARFVGPLFAEITLDTDLREPIGSL